VTYLTTGDKLTLRSATCRTRSGDQDEQSDGGIRRDSVVGYARTGVCHWTRNGKLARSRSIAVTYSQRRRCCTDTSAVPNADTYRFVDTELPSILKHDSKRLSWALG
jgi:hypothetical protein